jgi:xanthine dehydrogenase iron-sulfur cluster and FAD-binding subunit A
MIVVAERRCLRSILACLVAILACAAPSASAGIGTPPEVIERAKRATVGVLEKYPRATDVQLHKGLDGNICRCGTFPRILEAAMKVRGVSRG